MTSPDLIRVYAAFITAFGIAFLAIPGIIRLAIERNLMDEPDNDRKIHKRKVPSLGGIGIFGGFLISAALFIKIPQMPYLQYILAALTILFFIGAKDDLYPLVAKKKLLGQILAAFIICYLANVRLTSFYGILGIWQLNLVQSMIVSIITIVVIVNAFNLIDGIDGLAGTIGIFTILVFSLWFWYSRETELVVLSFACIGAIGGFLCYNYSPAKIFMGDTGSLVIGLLVATLAIKFIEFNKVQIDPYFIESAPSMTIAILIIPIFDTLRAFTIRILNGNSPFLADRNHIHQILIRIGMNHTQATFSLLSINVVVASLAFHFKYLGSLWLLIIILVLNIILFQFLEYLACKKEG